MTECIICGRSYESWLRFQDFICACGQSYEYEEGHHIVLSDAQRKLLANHAKTLRARTCRSHTQAMKAHGNRCIIRPYAKGVAPWERRFASTCLPLDAVLSDVQRKLYGNTRTNMCETCGRADGTHVPGFGCRS